MRSQRAGKNKVDESLRGRRGGERRGGEGKPVGLVFKRLFRPLCRIVIRSKVSVLTIVNG